jgi:hypothetical protein
LRKSKENKEQEEYEKYQQKMENYLKLQEMMRTGDPSSEYYGNYSPYGNEDLFEDEEQYMGEAAYFSNDNFGLPPSLMSQGIMYDPRYPQLPHPGIEAMNGHQTYDPRVNPDGQPNELFYNYALVQMDDFLKDEGISGADSMALVNSYYNNLALMQQHKPFLFPPPELGK